MRWIELTGLAGLVVVTACGDGGPAAMGRVEVGFATDASAPAAGVPLFADTYTDPSGNTLVIDSVSVVIRKLHLEGDSAMGCGDDGEMHDSLEMVSDSGEGDHEGDCEGLRVGPFLVELPLNGGVSHEFTVTVDTGTYSEVHFQIHTPEGPADSAFVAAHPEMAGASVRVVGTFNGTPFVYVTAVTAEQEIEFVPPLVVTEGSTSFTLRADLAGWFRSGAGTLIDPATALGDGVNVMLVRQNILRSFHGFEDEDHDGRDDHHESGMD